MMYHVDIVNNGDSQFKVKSNDYELMIDTKGNGITPPDALLASLGTCVGVYLHKYAQGAKVELKQFSISVDAEFTKEPPYCFREIKVNINLKGVVLEEQRKEALLRFIKNCPVHNTLKADPAVIIKIS
ncbi:MAG: OsmC family protein [Candidatus Omnitrophota bacterium]